MYRSGLGDCFLLSFNPETEPVHMLIDCGSLGASTTGVNLEEVVADIRKTTKDHLHLLVVTHEHQDHLSGFRSCRAEFEKIRVDNVWLAWTENPEEPLARQLARNKDDLAMAVAAAIRGLREPVYANPESTELADAAESILGFFGESSTLAAGALAKTTNEAMQFVRKALSANVDYLQPGGNAIEKPWLPGFRFYILGPPKSLAALSELGDPGSSDLYHLAMGLRVGAGGDDVSAQERENQMPFDARVRLPPDHPLAKSSLDLYLAPEESWRRIDHDWLRTAADLALQLDSLTNNTSLALAIERIADGRFLLFPADAQLGNWLSWHAPETTWLIDNGAASRTAADLLAQTVFYKVGHHGSHNATCSGKGLELMRRNDELVAFIPVDRRVALSRNPKGSWKMPARPLYRRLLEACQGRVVRSDLGWADLVKAPATDDPEKEFVRLAGPTQWKDWKKAQREAASTGRVAVQRLYVDYHL
jgi:hypothetical protein